MGNLMSFPVLCLLNKACFDISCSIRRGRERKRSGYRKCVINGDDVAFCGDKQFFRDWESVTSYFGLVVNREKTGVSLEFVELNSRSYSTRKRRLLRKPVLSCFLDQQQPACVLSSILSQLGTLSSEGLWRVIVSQRHRIVKYGVCLSSVPSRWVRYLLKRRWFRSVVLSPPITSVVGVVRAWPVVSRDVGPAESWRGVYDSACERLLTLGVQMATGLKVSPPLITASKVSVTETRRRISVRRRWSWRWPLPLWRWWVAHDLPLDSLSSLWEVDHADLTVCVEAYEDPIYASVPPPFSLLVGSVRPDGVDSV